MSLQSLVRRRPSAAMIVAVLALFLTLGGVGWAASQLPSNSVGTAQLQNASVTNWKILNGAVGNWKLAFGAVGPRKLENAAVGRAQINTGQVQARVTGTCSAGAISSIDSAGKVQCGSTPPQEFGTSSATTTLGSGASAVASEALPAGPSYLVLADPHAQITGGSGAQVEVDCTLSANGASLTRSLIVDKGANDQAGTIPLVLAAPSSHGAGTASVSCTKTSSGASPTVDVASTVNAIQTASNS